MLRLQAHAGVTGTLARSYEARFPLPVNTETMFGGAILACGVVHTPDVSVDQDHHAQQKNVAPVARAFIAVPLLRAGVPIGAIAMGRGSPGEFSAIQTELLQTLLSRR
jgi:GAF domain-containing protein